MSLVILGPNSYNARGSIVKRDFVTVSLHASLAKGLFLRISGLSSYGENKLGHLDFYLKDTESVHGLKTGLRRLVNGGEDLILGIPVSPDGIGEYSFTFRPRVAVLDITDSMPVPLITIMVSSGERHTLNTLIESLLKYIRQ